MTHVKGLFRRAMNHPYLLAVLFVLGMSGEKKGGVKERAECHMWGRSPHVPWGSHGKLHFNELHLNQVLQSAFPGTSRHFSVLGQLSHSCSAQSLGL